MTDTTDPAKWRSWPLLDQMELAAATLHAVRAGATEGAWYAADETMSSDDRERVHTANLVTGGWDIVSCSGGDTPPEDHPKDARAARAIADRDLIQLTAGNPVLLAFLEQNIADAVTAVKNAMDGLGGALGAHTMWDHEATLVMAQSILALRYTPEEHQYGRTPEFGVAAALRRG